MDIFSHVAIGREILANGIPETDVFSSAHPDAAWTPFQVGYEVLVAGLDAAGGLDLLRVFHALVLTVALLLAVDRLRKFTGDRWFAATLFVLLLFLFEERIRLRPHVFNLLFEVAFLLPLAAGWWRVNPKRWMWSLGMVGFLWGAVHAMAALWLLAVLGTVLVLGPGRQSRYWAVSAGGLAAVGIAAAPAAASGIAHVLSIQGAWSPYVPELAPSWATVELGTLHSWLSAVLPWLGVGGVLAAIVARPSPERRPTVLAAAGFAFASIWMLRLSYYAPFALALVAPELRVLLETRSGLPSRWLRGLAVTAAAALLFVIVQHQAGWWTVNPWTTTLQPGYFPTAEAKLLRSAGIGGRIFNQAEWGGYLLYELHPPSTVLSDGRVTFSPDVAELLDADSHPSQRRIVADIAAARYGTDLLVRRSRYFPGGSGWVLLIRGPLADVWSRAGPIAAERRRALARVAPKP